MTSAREKKIEAVSDLTELKAADTSHVDTGKPTVQVEPIRLELAGRLREANPEPDSLTAMRESGAGASPGTGRPSEQGLEICFLNEVTPAQRRKVEACKLPARATATCAAAQSPS